MNITEHLNYIRDFTKVYRSGKSLGKELLEAECLNIQYPFMLAPLKHGDLLAGRFEYPLVYFLPQTYSRRDGEGFGYIFDHSVFDELLKNGISENEKEELKQYKEFWESENTVALMKNSYSKEIRNALPSDNWTKESGVAFPLYRMAGSVMNYDFLLKHGVSGIKEIVEEKYNNSSKNKKSFYFAVLKALDIFCNSCQYYIDICSEMITTENDPEYKNHLQNLESALIEIKDNKPSSLLAAMQMMMIYNTISGSLNFGRIDEYLGDFLCEDLINNRIDEGIALNYIIGLWKLIIARNTAFDGRVIIGGKGRRNEKNADRFALLAMEATRRTNDILPQLMLRLYDGMNEELLIKAMEVLNEGNTFPMLYNDDINIKAVEKAFNVPYKEAEQYAPYGCGEYTINHKSFETPSGLLNLLKSLEITLTQGQDLATGKKLGLDLGRLEDFNDFGGLWEAYKKQTEYFIDQLAKQEELAYKIAGDTSPFLFLSILYDDCLDKGLGIFNGGIKYLGGTLETYGNTNTADSLHVIKKLVFEQKRFTLYQIVEMIKSNFKGFEKERKILLNVPKYGNDDEQADHMAKKVHDHVCRYTRSQNNKTSLHNYLVVIINNNANTVLGRTTLASADGRLAFTSMANANAASGGADKSGITALLNSLVKLDPSIHGGAVQNLKLSKSLFSDHREKIVALIKGYFKSGGTQLMLTVLSKSDLQNARKNPELYPNLLVRVGGYSARFVELESDIQDEILSRTLY